MGQRHTLLRGHKRGLDDFHLGGVYCLLLKCSSLDCSPYKTETNLAIEAKTPAIFAFLFEVVKVLVVHADLRE